jgi:SAM-dependent MidA family methyltransferase
VALDLDPGLGSVGNPALVRAVIDEMDGGAISFERFMELALYHPEHGYYRKPGRIGPQGDFLTSPHVHPMFGWAVAGWLHALWGSLGSPPEFTVVEPGAGSGRLAASVLDWAEGRDDAFSRALRYVALEPFGAGDDGRVEWRTSLAGLGAQAVVCNEVFDAFAVRLFEATGRGPVEVMVRWDGERFAETRGPVALIDGAPVTGRFEVNARTYAAMRELCRVVPRGAVLVFDYGYPQEELWAPWRTSGTLLCFYRHTAHEDPYVHVGEQDITAHVNFSDLTTAAEDEGFAVSGPVSQAEFLLRLGLGGVVDSSRGDMGEYFTRRRALEVLTDTGGLGRIRVLGASRGVDSLLPGFTEDL